MKPNSRLVATLALSIAMLAIPTFAADLATWSVVGDTITAAPNDASLAFQLTASAPNGEVFSQEFAAGELPAFRALDDFGQSLGNGAYTLELTAIPAARSRDNVANTATDRRIQTFSARMVGGAFVSPVAEGPLNKDQVIVDDLIVNGGSACVGLDCVNGESFGFDTIRMKENNLRLHFDDTSNSASFPQNDWRLIANDSGNGGASYLGIEDSTAGRIPFRVEAGAPVNALYVEDGGRIGLGTSTPVVELHVVDGDTPTLRLEQDGSSGFTPQTFDVASNEANFFIRDVTNGSRLVFKIKPGAPTSSIFVAADGNIGMNTESPSASLHVRRTDGTAQIFVEDTGGAGAADLLNLQNDGPARFVLNNTSTGTSEWVFNSANDGLRISDAEVTANTELLLEPNGNLTISGQLITTGPQCASGTPCDGVFSPDFEVESIEEHAAFMWENSYLKSVGPTAGGQPLNLSERTGRVLNELEKAHIYIEQLNNNLKAKDEELDGLKARMAALEQALGLDAAE